MTRLILILTTILFISLTACQKENLSTLGTTQQQSNELLQKANSGNSIAASDLPYETQKYLKNVYPTAPILAIYLNEQGFYYVVFKNDLVLYFNENGVYMKAITAQGNSNNIPNEALPAKAQKYLQINYSENPIGHSFKLSNQFQVFLSSGLVVYFDEYGTFMEDSNGGTGTEGEGEEEVNTEVPITFNELPSNVQKYTKIYFPMYEFGKAFKNTSGFKVYLENKLLLNFDQNGNYLSTDLSNAPNAIISKIMDFEELPLAAVKFIKNEFPNVSPHYTFKQSNEQYRSQLSNNLIIYFDMQGEFLEKVEI